MRVECPLPPSAVNKPLVSWVSQTRRDSLGTAAHRIPIIEVKWALLLLPRAHACTKQGLCDRVRPFIYFIYLSESALALSM